MFIDLKNYVFQFEKVCFSSEKLWFFDRKTLFIGDKQSFLIYYTSGLREKFSLSSEKQSIWKILFFKSKNIVFQRKTEFLEKLCFSIEKQSLSKTLLFNLINTVYRPINCDFRSKSLSVDKHSLSKSSASQFDKHCLSTDKLCFFDW